MVGEQRGKGDLVQDIRICSPLFKLVSPHGQVLNSQSVKSPLDDTADNKLLQPGSMHIGRLVLHVFLDKASTVGHWKLVFLELGGV